MSLNRDFRQCLVGTDHSSIAYVAALRGEDPQKVSPYSFTYVAQKLLLIRLVDILCSLDDTSKDKGKGKDVEPAIEFSGLRSVVSKVFICLETNC
jgi:hypothetical protein